MKATGRLFLQHLAGELWKDRFRVLLVALGVAWGTLSLAVLIGFGTEVVRRMHQVARNSGPAWLRFQAGATSKAFQGFPAGRLMWLELRDGPAMQASVAEIDRVCMEFSSGSGNPIRYRDRELLIPLSGVEPEFHQVRNFPVVPGGRRLHALDFRERRRVIFLGDRLRQRLFGSEAAVGKWVDLWGFPFLVIGVLQPRATINNYNGEDRDKALIPATTFQDLRGWRYPNFCLVQPLPGMESQQVVQEVYRWLGKKRGFDPNDRLAYSLYNHVETIQQVDSMVATSQRLNMVIGLFALLVALAGVANCLGLIMEEGRRESAVLLALGAPPGWLVALRIGQSLTMTWAGGALGLVAAQFVLALAARLPLEGDAREYLGTPRLDLLTAALLWVVLGATAVAFSWKPARRAAAVPPMTWIGKEE
ncbi:MAG: ABC transporter permease [Planctomycetota bacterium]|nr:MAG: ABC transporter permease [Planctomycetota bacterium]